jgi:hypothetical protein
VLDCLLANPAVAFYGHANQLPFIFQFASLNMASYGVSGAAEPSVSVASLDSSSYGSVLTLTISFRLSNITLLNPVSNVLIKKLQPKDGGPK